MKSSGASSGRNCADCSCALDHLPTWVLLPHANHHERDAGMIFAGGFFFKFRLDVPSFLFVESYLLVALYLAIVVVNAVLPTPDVVPYVFARCAPQRARASTTRVATDGAVRTWRDIVSPRQPACEIIPPRAPTPKSCSELFAAGLFAAIVV